MENRTIILASSSPRRIEMMKSHGINPIVMPSTVEETIPEELNMEQAVMYLALKKALSVEKAILNQQYDDSSKACLKTSEYPLPLIIAADTVVFKDRIIGKPVDFQDAINILQSLNGTSHYVATGVALLEVGTTVRRVFCEVTEVFFKNYTYDDIKAYIESDEPWDKAGSYAIQGQWGKYVDHYVGDYDNVIGFPWTRIEQELKKL